MVVAPDRVPSIVGFLHPMNVYLVPASASRYALYCEARAAPVSPDDPAPSTLWARVVASFKRAVDEGEAETHGLQAPEGRSRLRRLITRKLAEAVAEQRLLWHLRYETTVTLLHPDTLGSAEAIAIVRGELANDYARHRRWLVVDTLATLVTGPVFFFIPGPNVVSWYFSFRAVGHFFSMKGARRGLSVIEFTPQPSEALSAVASALEAEGVARVDQLERAAIALGLDRLPAFVERIADDRAATTP